MTVFGVTLSPELTAGLLGLSAAGVWWLISRIGRSKAALDKQAALDEQQARFTKLVTDSNAQLQAKIDANEAKAQAKREADATEIGKLNGALGVISEMFRNASEIKADLQIELAGARKELQKATADHKNELAAKDAAYTKNIQDLEERIANLEERIKLQAKDGKDRDDRMATLEQELSDVRDLNQRLIQERAQVEQPWLAKVAQLTDRAENAEGAAKIYVDHINALTNQNKLLRQALLDHGWSIPDEAGNAPDASTPPTQPVATPNGETNPIQEMKHGQDLAKVIAPKAEGD